MPNKIIVIGGSEGGTDALKLILPLLPPYYKIPLVLVQHRGSDSDDTILKILQRSCALRIVEPEDKEEIVGGKVYIAPADYHLLVEGNLFYLSLDEPWNYSRPSIDLLFQSVGEVFNQNAIGILLSGANYDGAQGLKFIAQKGGITLVQDPAFAVNPAMPQSALYLYPDHRILTPKKIGRYLMGI
jgi:two-component system chemotaxis response regulator CheB